MFLDHEDELLRLAAGGARGTRLVGGLGGLLEIALLRVALQPRLTPMSRVGRHVSGAACRADVAAATAHGAVFALAGARGAIVGGAAAALLEAALQQRHEVDHLATRGAWLGRLFAGFGQRVRLARLHLLFDAFLQVVAIRVGELPGLPLLGHLVDELERHVELASARRAGLLRRRGLRRLLDFFLVAQRVQHDDIADRHQRRDVLSVTQHERRHGKLLRLLQRFAQQRVDAFASLVGHEVVGRVEVVRRDRVAADEGLDVDGPRRFDVRAPEVLVRKHHVFALLIFISFDDVVPVHDLAGGLVVALVADRGEIALVEQVQLEGAGAGGRVQADRDVDQAEADGAVPEPARAPFARRRFSVVTAGNAIGAFFPTSYGRSPPAPAEARAARPADGSPGAGWDVVCEWER